MKKKALYLFLALALPGLIFVFLKRFGRNEFDIPRYFQTGVDSLNTVCGTHYAEPYRVPDSVLLKTGWHPGRPAVVILDTFRSGMNMSFEELKIDTTKLPVQVLAITKFAPSLQERWRTCVFMCSRPHNVVLIDQDRVIRGYYILPSRDEMDRLVMELEILLKQY